jgi:dipeptidyl-peptidase-3
MRQFLALSVALAAACSTPAPAPAPEAQSAPRKYLLERVDDAAVVQLYADGFSALPLDQKVLIWHLSEAAIAGRDIFYDQVSADALEMRDVLEAIVSHPATVDPKSLAEIRRYSTLFWINTGPYNNLTALKFVLNLTPQAFIDAARAAQAAGARFPLRAGETLDQLMARLGPMFFDASFKPSRTNRNPGKGADILTASSNNLYQGVTLKDLAGFKERYPLNSRLVKGPSGLVEEVYRVGGRYDAQIRAIVEHLEAARATATPPMARALDALVKWYRTGDATDRRAYDIAWVEDKASPVDTINGFTESYLDARGVKGSWEGIVFYVNREKTEAIRRLADNAQWFEDHMPWDPKYRKPNVTGITANAIDVVVETGDAGPVSAVGINLPNDESVREKHGSKSISLSNISEAYEKSAGPGMRDEFSWTPEESARAEKWAALAAEITTNMHEAIGHASGQLSPRLDGRPETFLKEHFSALEEARADLIGLYFIADPKTAELGIVPTADQGDIVRAEYEGYTRNALTQLRRVRTGSQIEQSHMRMRQMIIHWLIANTKAIERRQRDGKTFLVLVDPAAFRQGVGQLLAEVQRIKSEGDYAAAAKLFDTHGVHFDSTLRDEVVARVETLNLQSYTGFVMPKLEAVRGGGDVITDVRISYPQDLAAQMLEWSEKTRATRAELFRSAGR